MSFELPTLHTYPPRPGSPSLIQRNITEVLTVLDRDNEYATKVLESELEAKKQVVSTVNAIIPLGAFVAGVQSQIIAATYNTNDTKLQVATNAFGFVGLALDIIGASFATMHAIGLQKSIAQTPELLRSLNADQLRIAVSEMLKGVENGASPATEQVVQMLQAKMRERRKFWKFRRHLWNNSDDDQLQRHLRLFFPDDAGASSQLWFRQFEFLRSILVTASLEQEALAAPAPEVAIRGGMLCLFMSVICFAKYSQPRPVWMACLVIAVIYLAANIAGQIRVENPEIEPLLHAILSSEGSSDAVFDALKSYVERHHV